MKCPYKLGKVRTVANPCHQCSLNGYSAHERFSKQEERKEASKIERLEHINSALHDRAGRIFASISTKYLTLSHICVKIIP